MLAVSPLRSTGCKDEREEENIDRFSIAGGDQLHQEEFSCGSLLDSIDFDDIFIGIGDGDVLPDLEIDSSDMLADFSVSNGEADSSDNQLINVPALSAASDENNNERNGNRRQKQEQEEDGRGGEDGKSTSGSSTTNWNLNSTSAQAAGSDQEIVSKSEEVVHESVAKEESDSNDNNNDNNVNGNSNNNNKGRKSSGNNQNKGSQGKRKVKVDWTPELHRRFVQAVEQLGMDKAVPSKILEIMGIDCLTRHNIASHLQKYRSHQKHLRAREAEAASWSQRRQVYGGAGKRGDMNPWLAPTMGFPHHPLPPPPATSLQPFRALHVWGHPTHHAHDHHQAPLMHIWPKHLAHHHLGPSQLPRPPWMPQPPPPMLGQPPPPDPSYWHLHHQRVPNALTPGTPCFPQTLATRFPVPPVPGIPQHGIYKVDQSIGVVPTSQSDFQAPFDHFQPSKESIDAAIGDVLSKPWLPLPLGLKPPSLDSVMVELQRQGIPSVPPSAA